MADKETINLEGQEAPGGSSSTPQDQGDLVSTIDLAMSGTQEAPAEAKKTDTEEPAKAKEREKPEEEGKEAPKGGEGGEKKETKPDEEKKETPPEKAKGQEARYDRDPAWQRIIKQRDEEREARIKLEGRLEALEKRELKVEEGPEFENIRNMSNAEIKEALLDEDGDSKAFLANFGRQIESEIMNGLKGKLFTQEQVDARINEVVNETGLTSKIEAGYEQFAKENPGFDEMWVSGELQEHIDTYPWHTPISAFLELAKGKEDAEAAKKAEADIKARVDKAVKETEDRLRKEFVAKGGARVLPGGPSAVPRVGAIDPRLKDTKKHGGTAGALTRMLEEDAQAAGG